MFIGNRPQRNVLKPQFFANQMEALMRLSTKAQYAVLALVDITHHGKGTPMSLTAIAQRQNLPLPYLEQLFNKLKKAELVTSCRGSAGGYSLTNSPDTTYIEDIIAAVERPLKATRCETGSLVGCQIKGSRCLTHDLWTELEEIVHGFLSRISLSDVCNQKVLGSGQLFLAPPKEKRCG